MFHFMKKDKDDKRKEKERDKDKDKKKDKKERRITLEELRRLEEARRSLVGKVKKKDKLPSGITADYMESFTQAEREALASRGGPSGSDAVGVEGPPRPPKRPSLLRASGQTMADGDGTGQSSVRNEVNNYERLLQRRTSGGAAPPLPVKSPPSPSLSAPACSSVQRLARRFDSPATGRSPTLSPTSSLRSSASSATTASETRAGEAAGRGTPLRQFVGRQLVLPALSMAPPPPPRLLSVLRQPAGEFGFALRRSLVLERSSSGQRRRMVIFAEPSQGAACDTGLLPGDRLLEVNGVNVEEAEREQVVALIRGSGSSVSLKVQPIPEAAELSRRQSSDHAVSESVQARSEAQLAEEAAWRDEQHVWLVHRLGFTAAQLVPEPAADGRLRVRLQPSGDTVEVDEDDLEKANPCQLDRTQQLAHLRHLNESSVLHVLRLRYADSLVHTAAGAATLLINPMASQPVYSDKLVQLLRGCRPEELPPHVYGAAQTAHRALQWRRRDQSLLLLGRSGSGKTTAARHLLHYLAAAAASAATAPQQPAVNAEKLAAVWTLLEAFGNCRTALNANASRCTSLLSLDFDQSGQAVSGSLQVLMLERSRVVRRPAGELSFHVFYQLLWGASAALRQRLQLENVGDDNAFLAPSATSEQQQQQLQQRWSRTLQAAASLQLQQTETEALWAVLAAILHLGRAGVTKGPADKYQFGEPGAARRAAALLGVRLEELARAVFASEACGAATLARSAYRSAPRTPQPGRCPEGAAALEAFVAGLYAELVTVLVSLINRSISSGAHTINSIVVLDTPGLQNPASCGRQGGATFDEFCFNYVQERLQLLFHEQTVISERENYAQEGIALEESESEWEPAAGQSLVSLLETPPATALARGSEAAARRGLLWLLDEEALRPRPSDSAFLERALDMYNTRADRQLMSAGPAPGLFTLHHLQGTNPVTYAVDGWVAAAREVAAARAAAPLLLESQNATLSRLFVAARDASGTGGGGSVAGIDGSLSLRRASSIRRTFTSGPAAIKRNSRALLVKFQLDGIAEQLRRTRPHFLHCLLPQHEAGLCELQPATEHGLVNVPLLRSQIRGAQILEALRLYKLGFPERLALNEFRRRFSLLSPQPAAPETDDRAAADQLLQLLQLEPASCRLGLSQVLFRAGTLARLEERRDERLQGRLLRLQARCRGLLARRRFSRLKVQELAIRCIQKNVRQYLSVRSWPWWRLLVRVTPLLDVHRTEQQLRDATEELTALRERAGKLETANTTYKQDTDKLESKLAEMTADLAEEHHTATLATERLEAEQSERIRLEHDVQGLQEELGRVSALNGRLESELECRRGSVDLSAGSSDEDDTGAATVYRRKYEYTARELAYTRKRAEQQHEDDVEQMVVLKKQLDKKVESAHEEVDEQRQLVAQQKRKVARLQGELSDLRVHLEEQTSRNTVLEKKQRKFDVDTQSLQEELRQERQQREKACRERDQLQRELCSVDNDQAALRQELQLQTEKTAALRLQLDELSQPYGDDQPELRRAKQQLQLKCQQQEEELDDLAGQVSLLEQAKLRLEMSLEQLRKEHRREVAQKEEEADEARASASKKLKALEAQLETEHEERTGLLREKHQLERRCIELSEHTISTDDQQAVLKLRRDLKRTRALLKDTQAQLDKARAEASSKVQIRQLKNQVEDAEFAAALAAKARQSVEAELAETQQLLEESQRARAEAEARQQTASREALSLQAQADEQEEEAQQVMRRYRTAVSQLSEERQALQLQAAQLSELQVERAALQEQLAEAAVRLDALQGEASAAHEQRHLQLRLSELQSRCELELTARQRLESQTARLKEALEKAGSETEAARQREQATTDSQRRLQRQLRDITDQLSEAQRKEVDAAGQARSLASELRQAEAEAGQARADLKLAFKRIADLQNAMQAELDSDESDSGPGSGTDDDDDDDDLESFLSARLPTAGNGALGLHLESRSAGSAGSPLSPLSMASDPELRPGANGTGESEA